MTASLRSAQRRLVVRAVLGVALALPFFAVALGVPRLVPAYGDWIARRLAAASSLVRGIRVAPRPSDAQGGTAPPDDRPGARTGGWVDKHLDPALQEVTPALAGGASSTSARPRRAPRAGADASALSPGGVAARSIHVPAGAVQRAIDDAGKNIRGRTARGSDGKPRGVRLTGVSATGVGLEDGDTVVSVDGRPTMDEDAATDAALAAVAQGKSSLRCKVERGDQTIDVVVDLPLAPVPAR